MADKKKPTRRESRKIQNALGGYWNSPSPGRLTTNSQDSGVFPADLRRSSPLDPSSDPVGPGRGSQADARIIAASDTAESSFTSAASTPTPMSSQRNRNSRGPNRNGGQGEEVQLWQQSKDDMRQIVDMLNESTDNVRSIQGQDSYMTQNADDMSIEAEERKLEELFRKGVKNTDALLELIKATKERVQVLSAIQKAKEESEAEVKGSHLAGSSRSASGLLSGSGRNPSRSAAMRESPSLRDPTSLYDFDGAGDSPVPSPLGSHTRKLGGAAGSDRSGDRDTPSKAGSVEPQPPTGSTSATGSVSAPGSSSNTAMTPAAAAAATQRSRVVFVKGQDVAFKPKATNSSDSPDWYLGKVLQVLGEGKSRRYKVKDEDPDVPPEKRTEYRTSASNMIPIPSPGHELPELEKGKIVLALYPDSTTFYKAEVMGSEAATGKVSLKFEGEETSSLLQYVERRFVVEYRN